jgi:hypothetical protein
MSYLSRVVRGTARIPPRTIVAASLSAGGVDHDSLFVIANRRLSTAFANPRDGLWTNNATTTSTIRKASLTTRLMSSEVVLPEPPTSNHPHTPIPGVTGKLIYTETGE